ncbi:hypothetical protein JCM16303_006777 [Sporobolomyces ruberrimus]
MNYSYINHDSVASLIKSSAIPGKDYQIVDVRDEDFRGGNIPGAINAPSEQRTQETVQALVEKLEGVPKVIFHCTLSQVRGPKNARIYAEAIESRQRNQEQPPPSPPPSSPPSRTTTTTPASSNQNFSPNPFPNHEGEGKQEVYVLRDGFQGWQGLYRDDPKLVENFDERIWKGYSP